MEKLLSYHEVVARLGSARSHLLLGNGFSIACDPVFSYGSLYDAAVTAGLSPRAQEIFDHLGTNNFEGVMRLLEDAYWIATKYGVQPEQVADMLADVEIVKNTLVEAVAKSHLAHSGEVPDHKKASALTFLKRYHNIFTTNYDLLLYWVVMSEGDQPTFQDCFRADSDEPDSPYLVFAEKLGDSPGILFLHGALHLYVQRGELRKHSWIRTGKRLTELIRDGLDKRAYPLFVAEGSAEKKLEQIQRSGYLYYCLDKLARIKGPLILLGHSLSESDGHIVGTLARNGDLPRIYIGLFGAAESPSNTAIRVAAEKIKTARAALVASRPKVLPVEIAFFDAGTAKVWG